MANFFIRRPIFAWVLAIILMMAGALAILQLPVAQYPTIAPPAVSVSANYPGADAQTVQDTVTQVIEQNMNGIDNLMYMSSTSDSAGSVTITLTFQSGTDPDIAQVQVQNKLQLATPLLPQEVQQQGISVEKSSSSYLMVAGFVSDNPDTTQDDISDYVASNVKDTHSRLNGVGDVQLFSGDVRADPWRLGRLEQRDRLSRRAAQVFFEPDGFDRAVADLRPLMAENHPWPSLSVHMQRSVERVPVFGRDAPFAVFPVRSSRRVGLEYGRAEQAVGLAAYRREQIVFVPIGMAFGRPEIVPAPEAFVRNESGVGARPLFQVAARIAVKPFGTVQNVGLVGPEQVIRAVACDGQDIRVADMNPGKRHGPFRRLSGR